MSELKYLSDGRKVSVIGKINKTEYIVQEIFVTDNGDEIPSGDNFTAKSLHDTPVLSWKEKEAIRYNDLYEKKKKEVDSIEKEIRQLQSKRQAHSLVLKANDKFIKMFEEYDSDFMADVLTGNIKYVVHSQYSGIKVQTFEESFFDYNNYWGDARFNGIKMLSVLGMNENGDIRFNINRYCDGSGCDNEVQFFKDDDSLKEFLINEVGNLYEEDKLTLKTLNNIKQYYKPEKSIINELKTKEIAQYQEMYEKSLQQAEDMLNKNLKALDDE